MPLRMIEISAPDSASPTLSDLIKEHGGIDSWYSTKNKDGRRTTSVLIHLEQQQEFMDAVALMPPAVAAGLFLGAGEMGNAYGAALHLGVNVVCVSLAAQLVFSLSEIKPRTWYKRKKSEQSIKTNLAFWLGLLVILAGLIALRNWV